MKLPYRKNAIIKKEKFTEYLLSFIHPKGKSKAKFFHLIGFNLSNIGELEKELLKIGKTNNVKAINNKKEEIVVKYIIYGLINAPNGKQYKVKTIWAIEADSKIPHLVTAHRSV